MAVLPEAPRQDGPRNALELADRPEAELAQRAGGHPPDTPDPLDGQRRQKPRLAARRHDDEPVGLLEVRGDLGDELVGAEARRRREAGLVTDPPRDPTDGVERAPEEGRAAREVDEGLVHRDGLHERREVGEDRHDLE